MAQAVRAAIIAGINGTVAKAAAATGELAWWPVGSDQVTGLFATYVYRL